MDDEKQPLIQNTSVRETTADEILRDSSFCLSYIKLVPVTLLLHFAGGVGYYATIQWIREYVKETSGCLANTSFNKTENGNCIGNGSLGNIDPDSHIEQETAKWIMYTSLATAIPASFSSALLCSFSDSIGRNFLFVVVACSTLVRLTVCSLSMYYKWNLLWIVLAAGLDGLTGSVHTSVSAGILFLVDITRPGRHRTIALSVFDGLLMFCSTISGIMSGFLIKHAGFFISTTVCTGLALFGLLVIVWFLPETNINIDNSKSSSLCLKVWAATLYCNCREWKYIRRPFVLITVCYFFQNLAVSHRGSIEILYQLGKPFCWTPEMIGLFSAARSTGQGLIGVLSIIPIKKGLSEINVALISAVFNTGSYILEGLATTTLELFLVFAAFGFVAAPMLKSLLSSLTPASNQGTLVAILLTVETVTEIASSYGLNQLYYMSAPYFPGVVFLVLAGMASLAAIFEIVFKLTQNINYGKDEEKTRTDILEKKK
ncbi:solute carrier family 46 member 3-like isoform X2 [Dreissena polymorpha]|uniref:solute carrier family 46 member 3-like isoform X2 n=1 Tax=Dreissena polymorpha TaxID=45954 RepID=UPI00226418B1|nr:solute carrier family 46 member 3-like isoform X2 [Dreissena polymorpha]